MADTIVDIDLGGTSALLDRVADNLENTAPLMQDLSEVIHSGVEGNIRRQEGPGGKPWKVYLRVCGGTPYASTSYTSAKGLSPRVRRYLVEGPHKALV